MECSNKTDKKEMWPAERVAASYRKRARQNKRSRVATFPRSRDEPFETDVEAVMPDLGRERSRISPTSHVHYAVAACPRARRMHARSSGLVCMRGGGNSRALPSRIWHHCVEGLSVAQAVSLTRAIERIPIVILFITKRGIISSLPKPYRTTQFLQVPTAI